MTYAVSSGTLNSTIPYHTIPLSVSVVLLIRAPFCVVLFCVICVFCLLVVLVRLSVPVQVSDWNDSSLKWPVMCWWGRQTLHTHSLCLLVPLDSYVFPFRALTPLFGRLEGHPACKNTGCWFVGGDILSGALHIQLLPPWWQRHVC